MLSTLLNSEPPAPHTPPTGTVTHPHSPDVSSSKRRRSYSGAESPRKSRSPNKYPPYSPDGPVQEPPRTSPLSPVTPARSSLHSLVHARDEPPITGTSRSHTSHNNNTNNNMTTGTANGDAADGDVEMRTGTQDDDERMEEDVEDAIDPRNEEDADDDLGEDQDDDSEDDEDDDEDDEDDEEDSDDDDDSSDIVVLDGPSEGTGGDDVRVRVKTEPGNDAGGADGAEATAGGATDGEAVNELKPKKKGKRRVQSPDDEEDLPPPPPPLPTIRLDAELPKGTDESMTLDWNFAEQAAMAGFPILNAWGEDPLAGDDVVPPEPQPPVAEEGAVKEGGTAAEGTPAALPVPPPPLPIDGPLPPGVSAEEAREMAEMARRLEEKYDKPQRKVKKRRVDYDLNDPFIDDSDLQIDRPTYVGRPKKEGFYVHQGALELLEESPKKSRAKATRTTKKEVRGPRKSLSEAVREYELQHSHMGTRDEPIAIDSDADTPGPSAVRRTAFRSPSPPGVAELDDRPVDRALFKSASREPKYLPPFDEFPDEVAHRLRQLRRASLRHKWDPNNKGKFPDHLKSPLEAAGEAAFRYDLLCIVDKETTDSGHDRYHEKAFVAALCSVLPYNRLTLGKLVLKLCYLSYWKWLQECELEGLRQFRDLLDPEIPAMVNQYEEAKAEWDARHEENEIPDAAEDQDAKKADGPPRRPVFTQEMKEVFRQLVENTQEMVDINKKMEEWQQKIEGQSSELNMRKLLYNKIIRLYPENYMSSLVLSRQFTNYKRAGQGAKKDQE